MSLAGFFILESHMNPKTNVLSILFGKKPQVVAAPEAPQYSAGALRHPGGGFAAVGFDFDGSYLVLSRKTGRLVTLKGRLDESTLLSKFGAAYCMNEYGEEDPKLGDMVFRADKMAADIRQQCDDMGLVQRPEVRGPGLYLEDDRLIINTGNELCDEQGLPLTTTPMAGRVYVSGPYLGFDTDTPPATDAEVHQVESAFESFAFKQTYGAAVSLAWLASSAMGGTLPHSPSVILTAAYGAGKTTWAMLQKSLLGAQVVHRDGVPTAPQVLHATKDNIVALLCDEFEPAKVSADHLRKFGEVINAGFTRPSGEGGFSRVIGGKLQHFRAPAGVALCGIDMPMLEQALESRSVRLELTPRQRAGVNRHPLLDPAYTAEAEALGARLRRLVTLRYSVIRAVHDIAHAMLRSIGHSDRRADTWSPLIAGYIGLKHVKAPDLQVVRDLITQWGLNEVAKDDIEPVSEACLNVLLDRKIVLRHESAGKPSKSHVRLRDALRLLAALRDKPEASRQVDAQLQALGVRALYKDDTGGWQLAVAASVHSVGVRQLFQGTQWARHGWKDTLLRLNGAAKGQARIAGDSVKVVIVPLPKTVTEPLFGDEATSDAKAAPIEQGLMGVRAEWVR